MFKLGNISFRDAFLFVIAVKDDRAILRAGVRLLTIELRGVVNHGEEDFEERRVKGYLHGLCVSGFSGTHLFI